MNNEEKSYHIQDIISIFITFIFSSLCIYFTLAVHCTCLLFVLFHCKVAFWQTFYIKRNKWMNAQLLLMKHRGCKTVPALCWWRLLLSMGPMVNSDPVQNQTHNWWPKMYHSWLYHYVLCQIRRKSVHRGNWQNMWNRTIFSEREREFTFAICYRQSVCRLSVTFVHPTQMVEIFGNVSSPFCTLAVRWHPQNILRRSSKVNPSVGGLNAKRVEKILRFWKFQRPYLRNGAR